MILNGVNINEKKKIKFSLKKIFGIGYNKSNQINTVLGLSENVNLKFLNKKQFLKLNKSLTYYKQGLRLKREIKNNIEFLKEINNYRGIRHNYLLPVRGQRTHTNAGTFKRLKKNFKKKK